MLHSTFPLTVFREMEGVRIYWSDINFDLPTARACIEARTNHFVDRGNGVIHMQLVKINVIRI